MTTLDDFYKTWTEQDAAEALAADRETVAAVNTARAASDWRTLEKLGFASREYGPREGTYRWEFHQRSYEDILSELHLTPAEYAARRNAALDW